MAEVMKASATGRNLSISTKYAIETCTYLRKRQLTRARAILEAVIKKEQPIPFKRFTDGVGHRKGIATTGRYPLKCATELLALLKSAEANAVNKGMTGDLTITELRANKASKPMRGGRHSRREMKRTTVWVTLEEIPGTRKERKEKTQKTPKPAEKPAEVKKDAESREVVNATAKKEVKDNSKKTTLKSEKKEEKPQS